MGNDGTSTDGWQWNDIPDQPWGFGKPKIEIKKRGEAKNYHDGGYAPHWVDPKLGPAMKGKIGSSTDYGDRVAGGDWITRTFYSDHGVSAEGDPWTNKAGFAAGWSLDGTRSVGSSGVDIGGKLTVGARAQDQWQTHFLGTDITGNQQIAALGELGAKATVGKTGIDGGAEAFVGAKIGADYSVSKWGIGLGAGAEGWYGAGASSKVRFGWDDSTKTFNIGYTEGAAWGEGGKVNFGLSIDPNKFGHAAHQGANWVIDKAGDLASAGSKILNKVPPIIRIPTYPQASFTSDGARVLSSVESGGTSVVNTVAHPSAAIATVKDAGSMTVNAASTGASKVANAASNVATSAAHTASNVATSAAHTVASDATSAAHTVASDATSAAHTVASDATSAAHAVASGATTAAHAVSNDASKAFHKVSSWFADGGAVRGPGSSIGDKIPAYLSDGEFVMNARSTQMNRPFLQALNQDPMFLQRMLGQRQEERRRAPSSDAPSSGRGLDSRPLTVNMSVSSQDDVVSRLKVLAQQWELAHAH